MGSAAGQGRGDHGPGLGLDPGEVVGAAERLGVDLVDVLGAAGAGRETGGLGGDLQAADLGAVAGRLGELGLDRLARAQEASGDVQGAITTLETIAREPEAPLTILEPPWRVEARPPRPRELPVDVREKVGRRDRSD